MEGECRGRGFLGPHDSTDVLKRSYWLGASFNLLLWAQNNRTPVPVQLFCQAGSFLGVASCAIHCDLLHLVQHVHLLWGFLPTASSRENVVKYCFWDKVIVSKFFPRCFYLIPDSGRYARYFFKKILIQWIDTRGTNLDGLQTHVWPIQEECTLPLFSVL